MAKNNTFSLRFRRRRLGLTDYKKRLALLKSGLDRVVVRKSNNYFTISHVKYNSAGDKVVKSVTSKVLADFGVKKGFSNMASGYLIGFYFAKHLSPKGEVVLDLGLRKPARKIMSVVRGLHEGGLKTNVNEEKLPNMELINSRYDVSDFVKKISAGKVSKPKAVKKVVKK